jgi:hypothetical protein
MIARSGVPLLFLAGLLLASRAPALAQIQAAPRDPYLTALERRELSEQEKRNRARERERRFPKSSASGCATGTNCSPRGAGIQSHPVPGSGLVAVLHDIDVEKDALNVRFRFFNDGTESVTLAIDPGADYEAFYVEVNGEKRFILRNDDGSLQAKKSMERDLAPGSMESWWAKFPPLPPDAESFDVVVPPAPRFEAVPISAD